MTTPHYPAGCAAGSQVHGIAGLPRNLWQVNANNGNVNYDNRDNKAFVRPCRAVAARAGECRGGEVTTRALYKAWRSARRRKKPSGNQLAFDGRWMDNLIQLRDELNTQQWSPSPAVCFIAQRPKARQIHAPDFRDRVVHHWLVPQLEAIFEPGFVHDSFANRRGKGTLAAAQRLQRFIRQVHSGQGGGWYLQLDVHNFFNSIHRPTLWAMLKPRLAKAGASAAVLHVTHALVRRPTHAQGIIYRCTPAERARVPSHKRLENAAPQCGLPIGNLSSQFFANVYLDALDQFVKRTLKAPRYVRYVDDFVLVHRDRATLEHWKQQIEQFLADTLSLRLKDDVRLRPLSAGVDFLGYVSYPTHVRVRPRVLRHVRESIASWSAEHAVPGGFRATPRDARRLTSILASASGHLRHANAWRIQQKLLRDAPWVRRFQRATRFHYSLEGRRLYFRTAVAEKL